MRRFVLLVCVLAAAAAWGDFEKRVLIVTGQDYPGHKWRETAPVLAEAIRGDTRLEVVVTEEPKDLASPELDSYDAVVLHFMNWEQPDPGPEARANLKRFVEGGKGLVLVHFACGAFQDWPEFRNLAGRSYDPALRGHDPFGPFQVEITKERHPITDGLDAFETTDELYTCLAGDAPIRVLATARSKVDNKDYPIAFVLDYGAGRVFHSVLGHDAPALKNPPVARLFRRAAGWAAGLDPNETIRLFNGKNLDGFYTFIKGRGRGSDPKGVFTVQDGILRISGEEWGCITTEKEFENYQLVVEFKWGEKNWPPREEKARDSGLLVHSVGEDGSYSGIWMNSIECQMIEGGTGDFIVVGDGTDRFSITGPAAKEMHGSSPVYEPGGAPVTLHKGRLNWWGRDPEWQDVLGFRGPRDVERPLGEWNRYECIADGSRLKLVLNGEVVNECYDVRPSKGRIQIQSESAEVFVRRMDLTPVEPKLATFKPDKPVLLVLNKHEDTMSFVDPVALRPVKKIATGPNPHEIVISKDRRFAYLSNYAPPGNTISVIDLKRQEHVKQISTGEYSRIHGAAMAPDGRHAYFTAGQTGFVVEVDTETNEVTRGIPTHGKISHMVVVSPDGKRLYTANIATENVSVIDIASGDLITQIPCGKGCEGMAFTPDGKRLWVGNQTGGSISIVDVAANKVIETFECPGMPVRIKFTADGQRALVPSWTENGELVVIDVASRKELKRIPVGSQAIGIEISPDGRRAFVGCEKLDGVHVVDLAALSVVDVIHTGNGSDAMAWWHPPAN